jgi:PncC family amidohydrolase
MAAGVARRLGADVGIAVTGVAGPDVEEGQPVGTVWFGIALGGGDGPVDAVAAKLPGDRERIRQFATINLLDALRTRLRAA